jgi:predicted P-loop ATPase
MAVLRGTLLWELAELASVKRADVQTTKAYLTQRHDTFRPSHARQEVRYKRQTVFIATANPEQSGYIEIVHEAGERRYLPVYVAPEYDAPTNRGGIDQRGIQRDHEQLLFEAAHRVLSGEQWHPTAAEAAAIAPQVERVTAPGDDDDPWIPAFASWVSRHKTGEFTIADTLDLIRGAVNIESGRQSRADSLRAGRVLRTLGYSPTKRNGHVWWSKGTIDCA